MPRRTIPARDERGSTLVEMLIALVVLAIGVLALARAFPAGSQSQLQDRLTTTASYYAQQELEDLVPKSWNDPSIADGRHPSGTATESLGSGKWQRYYTVATMASPLDGVKKVTVTVAWTYYGNRSVNAVTYKRR